jgi:hypothetical protein
LLRQRVVGKHLDPFAPRDRVARQEGGQLGEEAAATARCRRCRWSLVATTGCSGSVVPPSCHDGDPSVRQKIYRYIFNPEV